MSNFGCRTAKGLLLSTLEGFQYFIRHPSCTWDERGRTFFEVIVSPQAKALFDGESVTLTLTLTWTLDGWGMLEELE